MLLQFNNSDSSFDKDNEQTHRKMESITRTNTIILLNISYDLWRKRRLAVYYQVQQLGYANRPPIRDVQSKLDSPSSDRAYLRCKAWLAISSSIRSTGAMISESLQVQVEVEMNVSDS